MAQYHPDLLERSVAPGITTFTDAVIPDLDGRFPEAPFWLANHYLNSIIGRRWVHELRQYAVAFMRRTFQALETCHAARSLTYRYLEGNDPHNPKVSAYYAAASKWESFAVDMVIACDLLNRVNRYFDSDEKVFKPDDGSPEQRLYTIGNAVKHVQSKRGEQPIPENVTVPLWLSETGLHSFDGLAVTYVEASEMLCDACTEAEAFQHPG